jgi:DnaJ-class molecular chaperone
MVNHYDILGVSQDAGDMEIKKAYRSLSLKYHPDRNDTEEAKEKIQAINQAYEILGDKAKRNQYNMELQFGQGSGGMPGFGGMGMPGFGMGGMPFAHMQSMNDMNDINNIFSMMFGQSMGGMGGPGGPEIRIFHGHGGPGMPGHGMNFHQQMRPEPIQKTIQITIDQSFTGSAIPIDIERTIINGNMRRTETETVYINIPQGIDDNESVTVHDRGHIVNDNKGEVRIVFRVQNNSQFKRHGLDLVYKQKISLKEALCGFSFEIVHLNGKRLCLNNASNPTVIKPNFKKIVPNLGMTREGSTGNMIIDFEIEFPESLTKEQIDTLTTIL